MTQIFNKEYADLAPLPPIKKKALAVFNIEDAKTAFNYGVCDFVIALNDTTQTFAYCYNLLDCENFWHVRKEINKA